MPPRGPSQNARARALHVPPRRLNDIVLEKRGTTADIAIHFCFCSSVTAFFGGMTGR